MKKWPKTRLEPAGGMLTMLDRTAGSAASGRGAGLAETRGSWRALQQPGQADQVVGRRREGEAPADPVDAAQSGLGLPAMVLIQANASSIRLRARWLAVAGDGGRSGGRCASRGPRCSGRMRRRLQRPQAGDKSRGIVGLVGPEGDPVPARDGSVSASAAARSAMPVAWVRPSRPPGPSGSPSADGP